MSDEWQVGDLALCVSNGDRPRAPLIDLAAAPSAMERDTLHWRKPATLARLDAAAADAVAVADGMVVCTRCSEWTPVPAWFGRDCIEAPCPLRDGMSACG